MAGTRERVPTDEELDKWEKEAAELAKRVAAGKRKRDNKRKILLGAYVEQEFLRRHPKAADPIKRGLVAWLSRPVDRDVFADWIGEVKALEARSQRTEKATPSAIPNPAPGATKPIAKPGNTTRGAERTGTVS